MRGTKTLINICIGLYLIAILNAFSYTILRKRFLPWLPTKYVYGMMAPFQSYGTDNNTLVAEGLKKDGTWEVIDVRTYFPVSDGEYGYRIIIPTTRERSQDLLKNQYQLFAEQLKKKEAERGRMYEEIRLSLDIWPKSVEGYEAERTPEKTKRIPAHHDS